jgi:hypothetical protein
MMRAKFWLIAALFYGVAIVLGLFASLIPPIEFGKTQINWGVIYFLLLFGYSLFSINGTKPDEGGLRLFLSEVLDSIPSGKNVFVPLGLFRLEKVQLSNQQSELPGEPEQIWRGRKKLRNADGSEREEPLPIGTVESGARVGYTPEGGWVEARRLNFNNDDPETAQDPLATLPNFRPTKKTDRDPLKERVTVELAITLHWRVQPDQVREFFLSLGLGDDEDPMRKARDQIGDIVLSEASNVLQVGTLARALNNVDLVSDYVRDKVRTAVAGWGVFIIMTKLEPFVMSHDLNRSIQSIADAEARRQSTVKDAQAEKARLIAVGKGTGKGEKARLEKTAKGMQQMADVAAKPGGALAIQAETVQKTFKPTDKVVIAGSLGDLATSVIAKNLLPPSPPSPTP